MSLSIEAWCLYLSDCASFLHHICCPSKQWATQHLVRQFLWLPDLPITQTICKWTAAQISQVVLSRLQWFGNSNLLVNLQHSMWKDMYGWNIVRLAAMQRPKKIWGIETLKALHILCYNVRTVAKNCEDLFWHVVSNFHASRSNGISMRQQSVIKNVEEGKVYWRCYVVQNQCNPFCFPKEKKGKPSV